MRIYTVYTRAPDGALRPQADYETRSAFRALSSFCTCNPTARGPFVVLPALTAAPLLID